MFQRLAVAPGVKPVFALTSFTGKAATVASGGLINVTATLTNLGTSEALAVRITGATFQVRNTVLPLVRESVNNQQLLALPVKLNTIAVKATSSPFILSFSGGAGIRAGVQGRLMLTATLGGGGKIAPVDVVLQ